MPTEVHMTATEMARLSDWLKSKGLTAEDAIECIHFIADGVLPAEKGIKNQASTDADNDMEA